MFKTMMHSTRLIALALSFAVALSGVTISAIAQADPSYRHEQRRDDRNGRSGGDKRAVRDMVGEVEHNYRGHVVDVQPPAANEDMYRVRVLQEGGRVKTLRVPAKREHDHGRD